jgi:hypothetical protein
MADAPHAASGSARPKNGRLKETGRASSATVYLQNAEEIASFVFASGPKGMKVIRKDCSEEEIISRGKGRTLVLAIDTPYKNTQPPQIGILLALKAGR